MRFLTERESERLMGLPEGWTAYGAEGVEIRPLARYNLDCYDFYPGIGDDEALGRYCVEEIGAIDIPEHIRDYFDYEAYGRDIDLNSTGNFVPGGYVLRNGEPFRECYAGREDIPEEYRICRALARNEKEETHSILETVRQFKEALPAPHKDREGPSHEGR